MEHITVDEIIEFVSFTELNQKNMDLVRRVNGHIMTCQECREKVEAFQVVHDELYRLGKGLDSNMITEDEIDEYLETDQIIDCLEVGEITQAPGAEIKLEQDLDLNLDLNLNS